MTLKKLLSASVLIAIGMMAGRVLGLLREMLVAAQYGTGSTADTAILLLILPDFVTSAFVGSAASAALVPAFAARTPEAARALYRQAMGVTLAAFAAIAAVIFAGAWLGNMAVPLPALAWTVLALPLSAATAILTAWLQYHSRFVIPAFATVIFNTAIILCLLAAPALQGLAAGIAAAGLVRLAAHVAAAARLPKPALDHSWQLDKPLRATYATAMGTGLLGLLPTYVPYGYVAAMGAGVAVFNYALKLVLMPSLLLQTVVQMAVLPYLVAARKEERENLPRQHADSLFYATLIAIIAALCLMLCAHPLAQLCFGYGKMTPQDIALLAKSFACGILAMPAMLAVTLLQSMLYAAQMPRPALRASAVQALLVLPLSALAEQSGGIPAVLAAFALLQAVPLALLLPACRRHGLLPTRIIGGKHATVAMVALAALLPGLLLLRNASLPPVAAIACAMGAGGVSLCAGAVTYRRKRHSHV